MGHKHYVLWCNGTWAHRGYARWTASCHFRWKFRAALIKMGMRFRGFVCYNILNSCITD